MPRVKTKPSKNGDIKTNGIEASKLDLDATSENDVDSAVGGTVDESLQSDEEKQEPIETIDTGILNNNSGLSNLMSQFYKEKEEDGSGNGSPASDNDSPAEEKNMGRGLNMVNPKIYTWMATKFCIEAGARTAVQEIIAQYKADFPKESQCMPLQSYQVGQLVRRHFPTIGRCKISQNGKRVWVYKDLGKRNFQSTTLPNALPDLLNEFHNKRIASPNEVKTEYGALASKFNLRDLPTMINLLNGSSGETGLDLYAADSSGYDDSFSSTTASSSKRLKTKHITNHTIDIQVVKWINDHYEAAEGFFVKSLELLAHFNSGNPRKPLQNLSQVGRLLKNSVNQNCKHLRRYFKGTEGGKREWVYTNIRVKPESLLEFNNAIDGKSWMDKTTPTPSVPSNTRPDSSNSSFDNKSTEEELKNLRNVIIATVQSQQDAPSLNGSDNVDGGSNQSEINGNLVNDDRNGMDKDTSSVTGLDKFKNLRVPGWEMTACTAKYVEWIRCERDFLINRLRIIIEVRIMDNWDLVIHANGRRVFPDSIGVNSIDHNLKSITEFMMGLTKLKFCRGFPAPLYRPLELQGHVVSSVEIWSRRSDEDTEEIRHRSLNCQLLFNADENFCQSCFHICRLNMQRVTSRGNSATVSLEESTAETVNDNESAPSLS